MGGVGNTAAQYRGLAGKINVADAGRSRAMDAVVVLSALVALGVLANRYGYDSRDGLCGPSTPRWWALGADDERTVKGIRGS
jgi:hypothetical protein